MREFSRRAHTLFENKIDFSRTRKLGQMYEGVCDMCMVAASRALALVYPVVSGDLSDAKRNSISGLNLDVFQFCFIFPTSTCSFSSSEIDS